MKKRLLAMMMAFVMAMSLLPMSALATGGEEQEPEVPPSGQQIVTGWFKADDESRSVTTRKEETPTKSTNGGKVSVSKTIEGTANENEFEVTLEVRTKQNISEIQEGADAAIVIVIDRSGSMNTEIKCQCKKYEAGGDRHTCKNCGHYHYNQCNTSETRLVAAKREAVTFMNRLLADAKDSQENYTGHRYISVVSFAGISNKTPDVIVNCDWVDITTQTGYANAKNAIESKNLKAEGGTHLQAGLQQAIKQMGIKNALAGTVNISALKNRYTVLLTDGKPTYANANDSNKTLIGNGTDYPTNDWFDVDGNNKILKQICDETTTTANSLTNLCNLYSICYGASSDVCYTTQSGTVTVPVTVKDFLDSISNACYSADDASELNTAFAGISRTIQLLAEAWEVTDPMGACIDFGDITSGQADKTAKCTGNTLVWNLKKDDPKGQEDSGKGETTYIYRLTYTIKLDTHDKSFVKNKEYATNGYTYLTYVFYNEKHQLVDENGNVLTVTGETKANEISFNVPIVKGYASDLSFTKVNENGTVLPEASFTLTCGGWTYTYLTEDGSEESTEVVSGGDGKVTFSDIPSGHSYTLKENNAPAGYQKVADITFDVSYGKIENVKSTGVPEKETTQVIETDSEGNQKLVDPLVPPTTGSLTISKDFAGKDANAIKAQFENTDPYKKISFTIKNSSDKTVGTVTLPEAKTADGVTTYTWSTTVNDLAPGTYTVTESGADVNGYGLKTTGTSATVTAGATVTMNVTNTYTKHVPNVTVAKELVSIGGVDASEDNKVAGEGQEIVWKITVTNNGMADAENLTLTDLLNGVENEKVTITPNKGTTYNEGGKTFNVPANGGKAEFTAKYKVTDADAGKTLTNSVTVGGKNASADPVYTFVKDVVTSEKRGSLPENVTNALTDKKLTPTYPAKDNDPVYLNKAESVTLLYAITVTGAKGTEYTIADDGVIVVGENVATGKIPESGTVTVYVAKTFTAKDISENTGKATNTATLTVGGKTDTATEETDVINIDVEKKVSQVGETEVKDDNIPMAQKDDVITWTITVTNNSKVTASGLKLTDNLNGVADKVAVKDANGQNALTEDYSFNLDAGETATFTATYTVTNDDAGTELVNVAVIKNGETIVEEGESETVTVDSMSISKTVVTSKDSVPVEIQNKLAGKTITYPTSQLSIKASDEVTLLYKIEVTGIEGRTYIISDNNATFLTNDVKDTCTVNIPQDNGDSDIIGSAAVYVIRTFKSSDIQDGNLTNVATMTDSESGKNVQDDAKTSAKEESTPVSPGGGGNHKPPVLNKEDHFGYIIGYPVDYETGEKTTDQTRMPVKPEGNITRAEVATIFFRMLTDESRTEFWSQTNDYSDVNEGQWFNAAISTLSNAGILNGYNDGTFRPNGKITRAEFATMASRFFEYADTAGDNPFSDVSEDSWYYKFVMAASEMGLINGYPDGTFGPGKLITRAEAVTIVNRTLDRHPDQDHFLKDMLVWVDNMDTSKWYYEAMQEATNSHEYEMKGSGDNKYENWTKMLEIRDWAAFEKEWSDANSAAGGEVVK